jgi:hypothetical protein
MEVMSFIARVLHRLCRKAEVLARARLKLVGAAKIVLSFALPLWG